MASADLQTRKTVLEDRIDSLGSWMIGFIWPVAVGLFIEFYAILDITYTRDWKSLIDRIGLLLVTAGVSGELLIEHKTHRAERVLRGLTAEIEREADLALKAADERIGELNLKAEQERTERVKLQLELERARQEIREAEQRAVQKSILAQDDRQKRKPQR